MEISGGETFLDREEKSIHHHRAKPPFFLYRGLRLYGVYPSFRTYGVYPFPLFSQENGIHHSFFCSVTSGSGDRPRKEGCHGGGVYSFFPCLESAGEAAGEGLKTFRTRFGSFFRSFFRVFQALFHVVSI